MDSSDPRHPGYVPPQPLDVLAWVTVRLHANGSISTSGTIADRAMALHLLDQARDAISRQIPDDKHQKLIVPSRDVEVMPSIPTTDLGSLAPGLRGDP